MMSYPLLLAARRISRRWAPLVGGFGLAAWDVFLDPQMVDDGRWRWADPTPGLPGVEGVPLTNFAGWLIVGVAMMAVLNALLPNVGSSEAQPATLLFWTWIGSVVGNVFWFGSPEVAVAGGVALGLVALPYAWVLWQSRP
jgi:putative membrane protein